MARSASARSLLVAALLVASVATTAGVAAAATTESVSADSGEPPPLVALLTDAAAPAGTDVDGDGLGAVEEFYRDTDPTVADTDGDGLDDGREVALGTDPVRADTDGDRLRDGWEVAGRAPAGADRSRAVALPGSDPRRMDLYVQVVHEGNATRLSELERATLRRQWARMPVGNPDGTTGVALHLDVSPAAAPDRDTSYGEYYAELVPPARRGVYRLAVVAPPGTTVGAGVSAAPAWTVLVDASPDTRTDGSPFRSVALTHELLHAVLGRLHPSNQCGSDRAHACMGYLSHDHRSLDHLPAGLAAELEDDGFEAPDSTP